MASKLLFKGLQRSSTRRLQTFLPARQSMPTGSIHSIADKKFDHLTIINPKPFVYNVQLNRPNKMNALNKVLWLEIGEAFETLGDDPDCRAVILSGNGKVFSAGIDLQELAEFASLATSESDLARRGKQLYPIIRRFQLAFQQIEKCPKPVIAAVHNVCVGGGTSMVTFADVRYCTKDALFQVKEAELGFAADVGALQQLPKLIGNQSLVREFCLTARKMYSDEAKECGLVNRVFEDVQGMMAYAVDVAERMASLGPVGVQGTKYHLNYARDHSVDESIEHVAQWNKMMLQSEDVMKAAMAVMTKSKEAPDFAKL